MFAISGLTLKEIDQTATANQLLCVAIILLFTAALSSTPALLEHPAQPSKPERPSIWLLPWIVKMLDASLIQRVLIQQAAYGGVAIKPTHLAYCGLPKLCQQLEKNKRPVQWSKLITLKGRDTSGGWHTARAKEYPPMLNDVFASTFVQEYQDRVADNTTTAPLPTTLQEIITELQSENFAVTDQVMRPDYGRYHRDLGSLD